MIPGPTGRLAVRGVIACALLSRGCEIARLGGLVALCGLMTVGNGCSFIFASGPPANHAELRYFDCSSDYAAPATDSVLLLSGVLTALSVFALSGLSDTAHSNTGPLLVAIPAVGIPGAATIYGYSKVGDCREARRALAARLSAPPPAPVPYAPPPSPPPPPSLPPPPASPPPPPGQEIKP